MYVEEEEKRSFFREFQEHPNLIFLVCSLVLAVLFWLLTLLPEINRLISLFFNVDILYLLKSGGPIGPGKMRYFKIGAAMLIGLNIALMVALIPKKGVAYRAMILIFILPFYPVAVSWLSQLRYDRFSKIRIEDLPPIEYDSIFAKTHILKAKINSFPDFSRFAIKRYFLYESYLRKRWGIEDRQKLQAIFFMNLVSAMWQYGNETGVGPGGCVLLNDMPDDAEKISVKTYLQSEVGCCTDYANILKYLLDSAGVKNRMVLLPGHIFNEAFVENRWQVFDATINIMFNRSWAEASFSRPNSDVVATTFQHINMIRHNNPHYSQMIGALRVEQLYWVLEKTNLNQSYVNELPFYIR